MWASVCSSASHTDSLHYNSLSPSSSSWESHLLFWSSLSSLAQLISPVQECLKLPRHLSLSLFALSCPAFPHLSFCSSLIWRPPQLWWAPAQEETCQEEIHACTRVHLLAHRHAHIDRIFKMLMFDSALIFSSTSVFIRCQIFFFLGWGGRRVFTLIWSHVEMRWEN